MLRRHNNKQRKNRLKRHALAGVSRAVGYPQTANYGQKPEPTLKLISLKKSEVIKAVLFRLLKYLHYANSVIQ